MNTQLNNVKISLRNDTLQNWQSNNTSLLKGEVATVVLEDGTTRIKVGDGTHTFNQLPYVESKVSLISGDVAYSSDLSVIKLTNAEYNQLVSLSAVNVSAIYVITDDFVDARGQVIKNLSGPVDDQDAATKKYVDDSIAAIPAPDLSQYYKKSETSSNAQLNVKFNTLSTYAQTKNQLSNDGYLTTHQSLSDYYKKSETSAAVQLSTEFGKQSRVSLISGDSVYSKDLSVLKLTNDEYNRLVLDEQTNESCLYVIKDSFLDARGQQLKQLSGPTDPEDAVTKAYADQIVSSISTDLTSYGKTLTYDSTVKKIYLKNGNNTLGTVDCADFIKDGMLSSVQLCGNVLVFKFNTDSGVSPISVNLSSFANIYTAGYGLTLTNGQFKVDTAKIAELSDLNSYVPTSRTVNGKQLTGNVSLTASDVGAYLMSQTSSAVQIASAINGCSKVSLLSGDEVYSKDLSVMNLTNDEYNIRVAGGEISESCVYIIQDRYTSMRGRQIKDLSAPTDNNDATTKKYVDDAISEKVDKVTGKGLSQNDFTDEYLQKVNDAASRHYVDGLIPYKVVEHTPVLSSVTVDGSSVQAYVVSTENRSINVVQMNSDTYPLFIYLPAEIPGSFARDLLVRVEVLTSTAPSIGFFGLDDEDCEFESEDDEWMTLEPGVNLFNFTETRK